MAHCLIYIYICIYRQINIKRGRDGYHCYEYCCYRYWYQPAALWRIWSFLLCTCFVICSPLRAFRLPLLRFALTLGSFGSLWAALGPLWDAWGCHEGLLGLSMGTYWVWVKMGRPISSKWLSSRMHAHNKWPPVAYLQIPATPQKWRKGRSS